MTPRHPLPFLWLLTDSRTDGTLDQAIGRLPRGSAIVFRHYHLPPAERLHRLQQVRTLARAGGHRVIWAGSAREAARLGLAGSYGADGTLATAHSLREIGRANRRKAAAILLSPVFPTRSHPGGKVLGPLRFRLLAARARVPVIALGGMTRRTARRLGWPRWAAIDGLA